MKSKKIYSIVSSGMLLGAMVLGSIAPVAAIHADTLPTNTVTVAAYLDGAPVTASAVNNTTFQVNENWNAVNTGQGSDSVILGPTGVNTSTEYQAVSPDYTTGGSYGMNLNLDGTTVGAYCMDNGGPAYALIGYTTGDNFAEAGSGASSTDNPSLTGMTSDKVIIIWLKTCAPSNNPPTYTVHVRGYLDGSETTANAASNYLFPMDATWQAANQDNGQQTTGSFTLGNGSDSAHPYDYSTVAFQTGASYSTMAITNDTDASSNVLPVGSECSQGKYVLQGYKTSSVSFDDAANMTLSTTAPSFSNLGSDEYVLVYDAKCTDTTGTINGDVTGGIEPGALAVTSITSVNSTATADGTFAHGWKYVFHVTIPDNETHVSMKFGDWMNTANSSTISAANNIRISSGQADNGGATILITGANTYSGALDMTADLDPNTAGKQVDITVEAKVPAGSANGSYTTTYGVQSLH